MEKMTLSQQGLELIKSFEGCRLTAYKPVKTEKYWTIGYGHYGADVKQGMTITQAKADQLLREDIMPIERSLNAMGINFRQECFDSLVSWIYNLGIGNFRQSTMRKRIVADAPDEEITDQLVKWVNSAGTPLLGLKRRRIAEANHWWLDQDVYYLDEYNNIKRRK